MSAWMILSEDGAQYQNTVEEKTLITKRFFMISKNRKCSIHAYAIMSEKNPRNAKLSPK